MSDERLPAERRDRGLVFDPGRTSPLVRRGLARLAAQASALVDHGGWWSLLWSCGLTQDARSDEDGTVYAPTPEGLLAIDGLTGVERWRLDIAASEYNVFQGASGLREWFVMGGLLLYPSGDRGLCAVDCATGKQRWCTGRQLREWAIAVSPDYHIVYTHVDDPANDLNGYICSLDASTGVARWCLMFTSQVQGPGKIADTQLHELLPVGRLTIVRDVDGRIVAVGETSGTVRWRTSDSYGLVTLIDGGLVCVRGGWDDDHPFLAALDLATGRERWRFEAPEGGLLIVHDEPEGGFFKESDEITDGTVYVAARDPGATIHNCGRQSLYALDAQDGTVRWSRELSFGSFRGHERDWGMGTRIAARHVQAVSSVLPRFFYDWSRAELIGIDPVVGEERWRFVPLQRESHRLLRPLVGVSAVYVENAGRLYALDQMSGQVLWTFERLVAGFRVGLDVVVEAENMVAVVCGDGNLYAVDAETGTIRDRFVFAASPAMADRIGPMLRDILQGSGTSYQRHFRALSEAHRLTHRAGTEEVAAVMDVVCRRLNKHFRWDVLRFKVRSRLQPGDGGSLWTSRPFDDRELTAIAGLVGFPVDQRLESLNPADIKRLLDLLEWPEDRRGEAAEIADLLTPVWPQAVDSWETLASSDTWRPPFFGRGPLEPAATTQVSGDLVYLRTQETLYALRWDRSIDRWRRSGQ